MNASPLVASVALALFAAGAIAQSPPPLETRKAMVEGVNPAVTAIWDVTNGATDEDGALDPTLMTPENWNKVADGALMLQTEARRMAQAQVFVAGGPANLASDELPPGVASREQIQAMIDADPDGFRASAAQMHEIASALLEAARARDTHATSELALELDAPCQSCHQRYWFPQAEPDPAG